MKSLTIGHLAREAGINLETVRYYERRGLLPKPPRSASGYRLFPSDAARRLRFIRRAQELGFSLKEIRELLSLRVSRTTTSRDIRARTEAKIADIEAKINSLESMKKTLRKLTGVCNGCAPLAKLACPACWPAYAGLLSSVGLGFLISTVYLLPLTAAFLVLALAALAFRANKRRGYGPFVVGLVAGSAVPLGKFAWASNLTMYSALGLLVMASLWNAWPLRDMRSEAAPCPECQREEV
ncbi:MAG TPA: MerR family DNA-binding protein [Candidatus Limnocylindria bacterium]|nr:MerR family DNA-binding protein [Candidatus Limnocylindria bacterium]